MKEVPKFIKDFSQEHSPEERKEVGGAIWEKRSEYFAEQKELAKKISQIVEDAKEKEKKAEEVVAEIKAIEEELILKKESTFKELFNFFAIKELEQNLSVKQLDHQQILQEHGDIQEILSELELQKSNASTLDDAKQMLADFYNKQEEAWQEYEKEKEIRDVSNIMRDNNVAFIHAIRPDFVPDDNSLLQEGATWRSKLDITLSLDPVLSTSTIKEGDTREKMWGGMGVLLKGGLVQRAYAHDGATVATGTKSRASHDAPIMPISQEINEALGGSHNYNEFVVDSGEVAGYYVCIDRNTGIMRYDLDSADNIIEVIEEMNMPLYVIEGGVIYEAVYVPAREDRSEAPPRKLSAYLTKGKKIEIAELLDNDFNLSEEEKLEKKEALFKNSPFKIKSTEVDLINSRSEGGNFYMTDEAIDWVNLPEAEEDFTELEERVQKHGYANGKEVKVVARVINATKDIYSVLIGKEKYFVYQNKLTKELRLNSIREYGMYRGSKFLCREKFDRKLETNEDYMQGMSNLISELQKKPDDFNQYRLKKLAFNLFGFSEEAVRAGDQDVADQAIELANKIVPKKEYQEIVDRRFDKEGNFLITEEDLN
ncbi:MAG: hypothetical protein HOD06_00215 [Candidatus Komeilibacteria bacterium]|nr:hypothetical protein [Candidatus Komeilibacteria bacterium]